jgi:predicted DsbA family dithiol-disulfide isomerase
MHAWLMENQRATEQEIVARAMELTGLEQEAFLALYRGREVAAVIREDVNGGQRIGIRSLPTLMLNGRVVPRWFVGERPYIEEIIDAAGKGAGTE